MAGVPPLGSDPRTQLLKMKAREEGYTDLEIMGLQRLAMAAWRVGASVNDIERNLPRMRPACRRMLGDPRVTGESLAVQGGCNNLLEPAGPHAHGQRFLGGVFAKRLVEPRTRMRKMAADVHRSADRSAAGACTAS